MLREGFDVNNICVIVPLRSSQASDPAGADVRPRSAPDVAGDDAIDELKRETRERIAKQLEPTNYFDVLFIVEHPAFAEFYDELLDDGLAVEVDDDADRQEPSRRPRDRRSPRAASRRTTSRSRWIVRDAEEELEEPIARSADAATSKYPVDLLMR